MPAGETAHAAPEVKKWHDHNWDEVLAGKGTADRYFARSGLIRKDLLASYAPPGRHPPTVVLRSFSELQQAFEDLGCGGKASKDSETRRSVRFVLKKAHSSNANGIRFFTEEEALRTIDAECDDAGKGLDEKVGSWPSRSIGEVLAALNGKKTDASFLRWAAVAGGLAVASGMFVFCCSGPRLANARGVGTALVAAPLLIPHAMVHQQCCSSSRNGSAAKVLETVREIQQLFEPPASKEGEVWVLQRHINPWLHCGRKFHLRVLLLCVGDLAAYVHEDVRLLLATEPFETGRWDSGRLHAHVTNMGVGRDHSEYSEDDQNLSLGVLGEEVAERFLREVIE
ncbi:unnamed protein product, partial [Polarella glacialis]